MDPWNNTQKHKDENLCDQFEDNFEPEIILNRLPDSEKYLAILEEKLHKVKTDPNLIEQLAKKKEDCFNQLLSTSEQVGLEYMKLDEPIGSPAVWRTILPQKQALTHGEVVELLKYDQFIQSETDSLGHTKHES